MRTWNANWRNGNGRCDTENDVTMKAPLLFIGLDVGGTSMKAGVVDDSGHPLGHVNLPTEPHKGQQHGLDTMCTAIRQAADAAELEIADIAAIGVATPGTMDLKTGYILDPPNLKPWRNVPVRDYIRDHFRLPT